MQTATQTGEKLNPPPRTATRILVAYASKYGSTKGIAEFIGEKLQQRGFNTDVRDVSDVKDMEIYESFVIGSAVFIGHWMKEARQFVSHNQSILSTRPVWIFSSGPTGNEEIDKKGRKVREISGPAELDEIRQSINPRDHHVFFGAFYADRLKGASRLFGRFIPEEAQGDFRNWTEIADWTNRIADSLASENT